MLNEIGDYLETNIGTALGLAAFPSNGLRFVRQGEAYPPSAYPYLFIVPGPFRPEWAEFGGVGPDRTYTFQLAGACIASSYANALTALEIQAKRVEEWCITNNGLGGLTDGQETVWESLPGAVTPQVQGSGTQWTGYFLVPLNVRTNSSS